MLQHRNYIQWHFPAAANPELMAYFYDGGLQAPRR